MLETSSGLRGRRCCEVTEVVRSFVVRVSLDSVRHYEKFSVIPNIYKMCGSRGPGFSLDHHVIGVAATRVLSRWRCGHAVPVGKPPVV